jgi:hypothetical protein
MGLFNQRGEALSPQDRRRRLFGTAGFVMVVLAAGFMVGIVRTWSALRSGKSWANYRGDVLTRGDLRTDLIFLLAGAVLSSALAWFWIRVSRRRV